MYEGVVPFFISKLIVFTKLYQTIQRGLRCVFILHFNLLVGLQLWN